MAAITTKRVYDPPQETDGVRILVDRIWPKGVTREEVRVDIWLKEVAPSDDLRRWFGKDEKKWREFKKRYSRELKEREKQIKIIKERAKMSPVTLVYSAKEEQNSAIVLKEYIDTVQ